MRNIQQVESHPQQSPTEIIVVSIGGEALDKRLRVCAKRCKIARILMRVRNLGGCRVAVAASREQCASEEEGGAGARSGEGGGSRRVR